MNDENVLISSKLMDFKKAVNPFSLTFLDQHFEDAFYKFKSINYYLIQNILFFSFISYFFIAIKPLQLFLLDTFDLNYIGGFQDSKAYLIASIRSLLYIILEIIVYFVPKIKIIRGLIISIGFSSELFYHSYLLNVNLKTSNFFCVFFLIPSFINSISISLVFCHNLVLGGFNFLAICLIGIVFIAISTLILFDKIIFIISIFSFGIIGELIIQYIDFIQRLSFYFMKIAIQEKNNTEKILKTLPEPVVIEEKGKIIFGNEAFQNIKTFIYSEDQDKENENRSISNLDESESDSKNLLNQISEHIINKDKDKSLKDYIESSEPIPNSTLFDYYEKNEKKEITFEIISKEVQSQSQHQIVFLLKNMTYYKKFTKGKSKKKYSRLFIASVTHNFRTPLNMVLGNSELLKDKVNEPEILEISNNIITGSNMLNILIEDLIDYSNLLTGVFQPKIRFFNINDLMNQMRDLFIGKFHDKSLLLEFFISPEVPQMINSDERRIMQIITHLLENALKFTIQGSAKVQIENLRRK